MLFIVMCALVFLTEKLSEVVIPLIWAGFFALPTGAVISTLEEAMLWFTTKIRNAYRRRREMPELLESRFLLEFKVVEGEFFFTASRDEHTQVG